jgi:hypothetical protein
MPGHLPYRDEIAQSKHDAAPSYTRSPMQQHVWESIVISMINDRISTPNLSLSNAVVVNGRDGLPALVLTKQEWASYPAGNRAELKSLGFTVEGE